MSSTADITAQLADKPYARLDYLLGKVPDPVLRSELDREVGKLRMNKKFGLVFEEHLPEHIRLYHLPIAIGAKVVLRYGRGDNAFVVEAVSKTKATIRQEIEGSTQEVDLKDLVVIKKFGDPVFPSLVPVDHVERSKDKPWHTIINAENFHALQLLLYAYEGKVDVIYIDPPYNTGARDWKYNNNYVDKNDSYRHSKWLSMMKRRFILSKRLLKPNGVMIVTIDENELPTLNILLWEIFPEYDVTPVTIRHNPRGIQGDNFSYCNEVALFVTKTRQKIINPRKISSEEQDASPLRKWGNDSTRHTAKNCFYPIYFDEGVYFKAGEVPVDDFHPKKAFQKLKSGIMEFWPIDNDGTERKWRYAKQSIEEISHLLSIEERNGTPQVIITKDTGQYKTMWVDSAYDSSTHGKRFLGKIVNADFSFPKSLYAVAECIRAAGKKDSLILDFFAGSGTTLHAACLLNAEELAEQKKKIEEADSPKRKQKLQQAMPSLGKRQCILVTNNEVEEKKDKELAQKSIYPSDKRYEAHGICEAVTWPRCKFTVNGKRDDKTILSGEYLSGRKLSEGFEENIQYFRLDYLDPDDIEYREKLSDVLPILWLTAGAAGAYEGLEKDGRWFIALNSCYAVLMKEEHFSAFQKELKKRSDITHVFLVTDAEESYRDMCAALPATLTTKMLYRSYLQNFRINISRDL